MWPRAVEVMLGLWLMASPFIFHRGELLQPVTAWEMIGGFLAFVAALFSFWPPARRAHLLTLLVSAALVARGYLMSAPPADPVGQNLMVVGILLALFAIIPTDNQRPPARWRAWYAGGTSYKSDKDVRT